MNDAYLLQCLGDPAIQVRLQAPVYVIGRASDVDLIIRHASISRRHAEIHVDPKRITVTDLGSRNGTYLEEQKIVHSQMLVNQHLRLGEVTFLLLRGEDCRGNDREETDVGPGETSPAVERARAIASAELLTRGQRRVFDLLLDGHSEKVIARRLKLSLHTVHNHVRGVYQKFQVHSRPELLSLHLGRTGSKGRADPEARPG